MKKKSLFSFLLLFIMLCSLSVFVSAGWKTDEESGDTYYVKSGHNLVNGPHTISGKKYLFTAEGVLIKDASTVYNGHTYVSRADGSLITSFVRYKNHYYLGTTYGYCKRGFQYYNKNYYYFNSSTGAAKMKAWYNRNGYTYYFRYNARAAKSSFRKIGEDTYYFNSKGQLVKSGYTKIGKYYYFLDKKTGKMRVGSVKSGNYWYYFNTTEGTNYGRAISKKWKTINGKQYYYNANGRRVTGWFVSGTKRYYLDPKANGARTYGKKTIGGYTYNFGTKGYVTNQLSGQKLVLRVNRSKCVVTAYDRGVPVKAMTCSPGAYSSPTPCGTFFLQDHLAWWMLNGPSYGQYCSHFLPSYLFHSVPVHGTSRNAYGVSANDYNRLGTPASGGCVRLSVADAKWIYYHAPIGSTVIISDHEPTPLGKPATLKMRAGTVGADPTDDFRNPAGYDR